jgi:hypothetical protein
MPNLITADELTSEVLKHKAACLGPDETYIGVYLEGPDWDHIIAVMREWELNDDSYDQGFSDGRKDH